MKRAAIIVIDSMGIGAIEDACDYGDDLTCNTLCNLAKKEGGLNVPNFEKLGLGNIKDIEGVKKTDTPEAKYGIMKMKSKGKDTTTGHWEIAGLVLKHPFRTYEKFPPEIIDEFIKQTDCKGILGNIPASGTKIIEDMHKEHEKTKFPIVYTSADSVFQVAVDIDIIPLETLYDWCKIARKILDDGNWGVSRVIARPYQIIEGKPTRIGKFRHDYSVPPPESTLLNKVQDAGKKVLSIGKIKDIFVNSGISGAIPTGSNKEGLEATVKSLKEKKWDLIFTNLVDTDMLYGHRRDSYGYKCAIEQIDSYLSEIISSLDSDDLLIITADHGCDPTFRGTDHTREMVPILVYNKNLRGENIGTLPSFTYVSDIVKNWLEII
ncbi:TPA: phosphopentomutase [Candidatus Galligastranaerophilus faecipullorum]|nr:phosphopentomutase [Candidatus Galligastranaerophilus faecipullorum]